MNMSLLAITGAAVTIGVVALSPPEHALRISVFAPPPPSAAEERAIARTFDADIRDKALIDALQFCAQSVELRLQVAGNAIESSGVALDNPVTVVDHHATLETFFHALADAIATTPDQRIGYRIDDGILRVSTVRALDRQETVLACYDLSSLAGDVPTDAVPELIQKFVEPAGWEENGGDMAKQHLVGARWFVEAPRRYQAQIEWFLSRLAEPSAGGAARQADPMGVDPTAGR